MHSNNGFSLIEVMIVVTIIAILAGLTLPTYQTNSTRARMTDNVRVLESLSQQVMVHYNSKGVMPDSLEGITGTGVGGGYGVYEVSNLTTHLHYDNGSVIIP